jgi:hypothetical protein
VREHDWQPYLDDTTDFDQALANLAANLEAGVRIAGVERPTVVVNVDQTARWGLW